MQPSFGENVQVRTTAETEEAELAGLKGQVYGVTTPSVTDVGVIGSPVGDLVFNVHFEDRCQGFWFSPELLEVLVTCCTRLGHSSC